ncbi:MAG: Coenzyme F420 hydrogenase/dehydrogenase, beta subunit C-terminal domain [Candidatus Methanofastidiosia archaeon]
MTDVLKTIIVKENETRNPPLAKNCFVGVSCQINGVRKIEKMTKILRGLPKVEERVYFPYPFWPAGKQFLIGIFCTENFSHNSLEEFIKRKWGLLMDKVKKVNISGGRLYVHTREDVLSCQIKEFSPYARGNCKLCPDFMADFADISVGNVGSKEGYSTVILRTDEGKLFFKKALAAGIIKAEDIHDRKALEKLFKYNKKEAYKNKEKREKMGFDIKFLEKWDKDEDPDSFIKFVNENNLFEELEEDIVLQGQCVNCGACGLVCPDHNIRFENDRPYAINRCPDVLCGYCYMVCPRTLSFHKQWAKTDNIQMFSVKATRTEGSVQDGGVVSAMLEFGLKRGFFETVTVTGGDEKQRPTVVTTNDIKQVRAAAGSKYSVTPGVLGLRMAR